MFFSRGSTFDKVLDLKLSESFETKMRTYLELFETDP